MRNQARLFALALLLWCVLLLRSGSGNHAAGLEAGVWLAQKPAAIQTSIFLPYLLYDWQAPPALPLLIDRFENTQPALSPDGQTLVYVSERNGQQEIFALPSASSTPINLTNTPDAQEETPTFTPDGRAIAFASNRSGDWDIYLMDPDGSNVRTAVAVTSSHELHPSFMPDGASLVFSSDRNAGNWDIYRAPVAGPPSTWERLTNDPATERFPTASADGTFIVFRREVAGNSDIAIMDATGQLVNHLTMDASFDGYPTLTTDDSGILFTSNRTGRFKSYLMNLAGEGVADISPTSQWTFDTPRSGRGDTEIVYAGQPPGGSSDIYAAHIVTPLYRVAERGWVNLDGDCSWEAGVLAYGWIKAWRTTGSHDYLTWTQQWVDGCMPQLSTFSHINDALVGYGALAVYGETQRGIYLTFAQRVADYVMNQAPRTANGTLIHVDDTVWVDTLVSAIPFLIEMHQTTNETLYLDEAIRQVMQHAAMLQNVDTGLYHHAWSESLNGVLGKSYWCRGNSWPLLADIELLAMLPADHAKRADILSIFRRQVAALAPLQAADGRWPTVVNRSDFYLETSGSAQIAAALLAGLRNGWLDPQTLGMTAWNARLGAWHQVNQDGTVQNVSAPTHPMAEDDYNSIPATDFQRYGQGAVLLLGAAGP